MSKKSFTDGFDITDERLEEIRNLAQDTVWYWNGISARCGHRSSGDDISDAEMGEVISCMNLSTKKLKTINEGICYGFALRNLLIENNVSTQRTML